MACQFTDEQTGGHCPDLAEHFTGTARSGSRSPTACTPTRSTRRRSTAGTTSWSCSWRGQKPSFRHRSKPWLRRCTARCSGSTASTCPTTRSRPSRATRGAERVRAPRRVRILFDNGAGSLTPGNPVPAFEQSFPRFPLPGTHARSWYLAGGGRAQGHSVWRGSADAFTWNKCARPATDFTGDTGGGAEGCGRATPPYNWTQNPAGTAVSYVTPAAAPQHRRGRRRGGAGLDQASASDVDLQATITEVRPDGKETFVQSGWLRASERKLDPSEHAARSRCPPSARPTSGRCRPGGS